MFNEQALLYKIATLESERDDAIKIKEAEKKILLEEIAKNQALEAVVQKLREDLRMSLISFGLHRPFCAALKKMNHVCDCGYEEALRAALNSNAGEKE